jgi:ABC-2 type transport system permease protein
VLAATGLAVGWSIDAGAADAVSGFALLVLFAAAMIWLGTLIGVVARSPEGVQGIAFVTVFPLTFLSNAFVPAAGLPDGLQQIAEWNPISAIVAATRTLFGNPTAVPADAPWPLEHPVLAAVLWSLAILAIAAPLCIAAFRRRTTG